MTVGFFMPCFYCKFYVEIYYLIVVFSLYHPQSPTAVIDLIYVSL